MRWPRRKTSERELIDHLTAAYLRGLHKGTEELEQKVDAAFKAGAAMQRALDAEDDDPFEDLRTKARFN